MLKKYVLCHALQMKCFQQRIKMTISPFFFISGKNRLSEFSPNRDKVYRALEGCCLQLSANSQQSRQ